MELGKEAAAIEAEFEATSQAVLALEGEFVTAESRSQFDRLFRRAQAVASTIETGAPPESPRLAAVQRHLQDILRRARSDYDRRQEVADSELAVTLDRLALSLETLGEVDSISGIQEVRADLRLIREAVRTASAWASRGSQARSWNAWQTANQTAWTILNECWKVNELALSSLLDQTATELDRGEPGVAKAKIKEFHDQAKQLETSHDALKTLRGRARELWERATVDSKERHEAYLVLARRRLEYMRTLWDAAQQRERRLAAEMSALELTLQRAQTEVAAALIRGQLDAGRKELRRLQTETARLGQRIGIADRREV